MRKTMTKNKYQKAAHRPGERKISRAEVAELLELSCSQDADERLVAAQLLCPCHIRTRITAAWDAIHRLMEDPDRRVRFAAWHTLEDGGVPDEPETFAQLERLMERETDPKVRKFAGQILRPKLTARKQQEWQWLHLAGHPAIQQHGKCDFCGAQNVIVERDFDTLIPTGDWPRPALICAPCAQNS